MEFFTWLSEGGGYLVVLLTLSASLGAVVNHVREMVTAARRPHRELEERVGNLEEALEDALSAHKEYDKMFKRDLERFDDSSTESRIILKTLLTLINSSIDGNHVDELKERQLELQQYLIGKV